MSDTLRIAVAGGGTGGHVYPGLAVVERLQARIETRALFIGARGGGEESILARAGRDYQLLPGYGLRRATFARKAAAPLVLTAAVVRAARARNMASITSPRACFTARAAKCRSSGAFRSAAFTTRFASNTRS